MRREYRAGPHIRRGSVRPRAHLLAFAQHLGLAPPDAEDLVQELYVRLPKLMATDEPIRDLFVYLFACLRRLAANVRVRERQRIRLLGQCPSVARVDPGHEAWLLAYITVERILDGLPGADAELLRRRIMQDRPREEIAESLGITEDAVWKRIQRPVAKARAGSTHSERAERPRTSRSRHDVQKWPARDTI